MSESNSENDFYSHYVGDGSSPPPPTSDNAEEPTVTTSHFDPLGGPGDDAPGTNSRAAEPPRTRPLKLNPPRNRPP